MHRRLPVARGPFQRRTPTDAGFDRRGTRRLVCCCSFQGFGLFFVCRVNVWASIARRQPDRLLPHRRCHLLLRRVVVDLGVRAHIATTIPLGCGSEGLLRIGEGGFDQVARVDEHLPNDSIVGVQPQLLPDVGTGDERRDDAVMIAFIDNPNVPVERTRITQMALPTFTTS
jgi:hypothetical protein